MDSSALLAREAAHRLHERGFEAYLVGGCVRDLLLGREPTDYDLATNARPSDILALFPKAQLVGAHFGVVLLREGPAEVEIATFRSDHAYQDGRHPGFVEFENDARQDVLRRDFTVNALLMEPEGGEVLDFVGGRRDLELKVIRAIGDPGARFREDHLRMLRAIRFAARLGFVIEAGTLGAIRELRDLALNVSAERVRDELFRILTEGAARRGFELLDESGLLSVLLPEVAAMKGVQQPPEFHPEGDVWTHTLMMLERMEATSVTLAWAVLLHDVGKPGTFSIQERIRFDGHAEVGARIAAAILSRLRCSHDEVERVEALVANHLRFKDVRNMRESTLKRFLRMERFEEHLELHRLDCIASHGYLDNYEFAKWKLQEFSSEQLKPKPLVTGFDLIRAGYKPGPAFSQMLKVVEDAQLESRITTPEEGLALVQSLFAPPDASPIRGDS